MAMAMDYLQAFEAMVEGHKVENPHKKGYFYYNSDDGLIYSRQTEAIGAAPFRYRLDEWLQECRDIDKTMSWEIYEEPKRCGRICCKEEFTPEEIDKIKELIAQTCENH